MFKVLYAVMHETLWNPKATGTEAPAGHRVNEEIEESAGSITGDRMFCKLGLSLVASISEKRRPGIGSETGAREASQIEPASKEDPDTNSPEGSDECWVYDRSLDSTSGNGNNRESIWHFLPSQPSLEISNRDGMELSETGKTGQGTRREDNCVLEKIFVAAYKKTPKSLDPTWCSSMKVDSSWFPMLSGHGHPEERLPSFVVWDSGKKSLQSRPSASLQTGNELHCMPGSISDRTSSLLRWPNSSTTCSATCAVTWYCSGTVAHHIKASRLENLYASIPVCTRIDFLDMLRSSIRTNSSGIRLNALCPTAFQKTCVILNNSCMLHFRECVNHRIYSGLVSMLPIYHGRISTFHYLCVSQ
jgi:hypothetical protein